MAAAEPPSSSEATHGGQVGPLQGLSGVLGAPGQVQAQPVAVGLEGLRALALGLEREVPRARELFDVGHVHDTQPIEYLD